MDAYESTCWLRASGVLCLLVLSRRGASLAVTCALRDPALVGFSGFGAIFAGGLPGWSAPATAG